MCVFVRMKCLGVCMPGQMIPKSATALRTYEMSVNLCGSEGENVQGHIHAYVCSTAEMKGRRDPMDPEHFRKEEVVLCRIRAYKVT